MLTSGLNLINESSWGYFILTDWTKSFVKIFQNGPYTNKQNERELEQSATSVKSPIFIYNTKRFQRAKNMNNLNKRNGENTKRKDLW